MPIIESVMGIQVIGNNGENIIKSPIVEAYIGSSLLDSTEVASDTPTDISTKVEQLMAAKHNHSNKAVLDKFAETDGKPTYNGEALGGGTGGASTAANVSYTNTQLPNVKNVKTALDELVPDSHNHNNKDTLDKLSDSNGKLQYNGSDVSLKPTYYIDLAGKYPNYTCPVAMDDIKAAYNAGYNLVCRCSLGAYTATLPLFIPMPVANTWIFSGSGCLQSMGFPAQSFTIAITSNGVAAQRTELAKEEDIPTMLPNPNFLYITVGDTHYYYDGSEQINIVIDDGTEVSY